MPRIRIELPAHFVFSTEITLYLSHMNYGGHLDNALLLSVVSEARLRFFKSLGYTELDIEGLGIIVADAAVQYQSEAFHGEVMVLRMTAADFGSKGCDLLWSMTEQSSGREVARGKTGIVFFDYAARQVAAVPENFRRRLAASTPPDTRDSGASGETAPV
ncbi:MAG: thioesterase family protein [Candidatus Accumulibacter sp. UW26]|jgi:acyl-CoA thioester hydrolase